MRQGDSPFVSFINVPIMGISLLTYVTGGEVTYAEARARQV